MNLSKPNAPIPVAPYIVQWVWVQEPTRVFNEGVKASTAPRAVNKVRDLIRAEYANWADARILQVLRDDLPY